MNATILYSFNDNICSKNGSCWISRGKKRIYNLIIEFFDNEDDEKQPYFNLINKFKIFQIKMTKEDFKEILFMIIFISRHHHRSPNFFGKIQNILIYFSKFMKKNFTNMEIFTLFSTEKRILLFLIKKNLLKSLFISIKMT